MRREEIAAELRWWFKESRGELGLHSNFRSIVARIEGGGGQGEVYHLDLRRIEAATRARGIARVFYALPPWEAMVLTAAYSTESEYRLFWVMRILPDAAEEHRKSRSTRTLTDWLTRLCVSARKGIEFERRRLFARIHSTADKALRGALDAYAREQKRADEDRLLGPGAS